ncbi:MAG: tetratricopeptide repeat protein [Deltaproteobacteria bacterium]|nr:tetratricopeptide repeat protein [Deltaproteobacteria bacterium]
MRCGAALFLCVVLSSSWTGCAEKATLLVGRDALRVGELSRASRVCGKVSQQSGSRDTQLAALRCWLEAARRRGRLRDVDATLAARPVDAPTLYARALAQLAQDPSRVDQALQLLQQASRLWPRQGEILYRQALVLLTDNRPKAALELLRRCETLQPSARCILAGGHALLDLGETQQAQQKLRKAAMSELLPADVQQGHSLAARLARRARRAPAKATRELKRAKVALDANRNAAALALLKALTLDYPELGYAHSLLGVALLAQEEVAEAVVAFRRAKELSPLDGANAFYLGLIYESRGRRSEAEASYRAALERDPFLTRALSRLGGLLMQGKRQKAAAKVFDRLAAMSTGASAWRLAGRAYIATGAWEAARHRYERVLADNSRDFEAHLRLGEILLHQAAARSNSRAGESKEQLLARVREHATAAASLRPMNPDVRELFAKLRQQQ